MNDPRPLYRELTSGTVGAAPTATVATARRAIDEGARDLDTVRSGLRHCWSGLGADRAAQCFDRRSAELTAADAELSVAIELLAALAAEQERVKHGAAPLIGWWCRAYVLFFFTDPVLLELISAQVHAALMQLRATHRTELQRIASAFDGLAGGAEQASAQVPTRSGALPPAGTAPQAVAAWWKGLSPAQQSALQAQHPDALAELDGLPPTVLDAVNRSRIPRDRAQAQSDLVTADAGLRKHGLVGMPDAQLLSNRDPEVRRLAREHAQAQSQLDRTNEVDAAVRSAQATAAAPPIGPVLLVAYRNTGAGGLAIAFGDPSTARDVAVSVPGTTAGPGSPGLEQASALRREMDRRDPRGSHATVQWIDYDAPDSITSTDVLNPADARDGATRLVGDVAGWRAGAGANQHVTVIGHSYGSTLVGIAAQHGLAADDVAVVGSPGVGASSADGLSPGRGHVWAGAAEHDPVVQLTQGSWFTQDGSGHGPYDKAFGAQQFDVRNPAAGVSGHTEYYAEGSTSLRNLGAIATGAFSAVTGADPGNRPTANTVEQVWEGGTDVLRGGGRTAAELLRGHPVDAVHNVAATVHEAVADTVDVVANRTGRHIEGHTAPLKKVLDLLL